MLLKEIITKTTGFFTDKGYSSPRLDTELLLAHALKWDRIKLYMNYDYPLTEQEMTTARELVKRRAQGEPVAYILGTREFYKSKFHVEPGVLIPRPETEEIVEQAVQWLSQFEQPSKTVIDLGTGSGCLGLSIIKEIPEAELFAVDVSAVAIKVAAQNANLLGLSERSTFTQMKAEELTPHKLPESFDGLVDALVANPPYIAASDKEVEANVKKFEPQEALFSDDNGLAHIRSWSKIAGDLVRPGGFVMFEIGWDQGPAAREIFTKDGRFDKIEIAKDLAQHDRFVRCKKI